MIIYLFTDTQFLYDLLGDLGLGPAVLLAGLLLLEPLPSTTSNGMSLSWSSFCICVARQPSTNTSIASVFSSKMLIAGKFIAVMLLVITEKQFQDKTALLLQKNFKHTLDHPLLSKLCLSSRVSIKPVNYV